MRNVTVATSPQSAQEPPRSTFCFLLAGQHKGSLLGAAGSLIGDNESKRERFLRDLLLKITREGSAGHHTESAAASKAIDRTYCGGANAPPSASRWSNRDALKERRSTRGISRRRKREC
jgi:hypothetical protein